ncbi:G-type lectin S-receptor-like serine/threonine-protein kinase [Camellia lanceoleosa]|uniref:G-type lectin S-receptor-like serine/threonine-protein kinase n=1 Tax=Camellia lanceoleosa TaxID=1840588 RepID=A0ACC0FNK0_9ERIC|nr:G-type lectin S-receptor-like serine/threonine-protein kinase [Camellia lanceoleosa]
MCGNGEGFVKMERAKIPQTSQRDEEMNLSMEECEAKCLRNCSCTAYTIASDGGNYCLTWYGTLMNARTAHSARHSLYIRVDADELLGKEDDHCGDICCGDGSPDYLLSLLVGNEEGKKSCWIRHSCQ